MGDNTSAGGGAMGRGRTVRAAIAESAVTFSPAEQRVASALLDDYPVAGLGSLAQLAEGAGVSGPTVLRLIGKLGFGGYAEFREAMRKEVAAQLHSPLESYRPAGDEPIDRGSTSALLSEMEVTYSQGLRSTMGALDSDVFDAVIDLIADPSRGVVVTGGRFSATLAAHLAWYLQVLRPGVAEVAPEDGGRARALLSLDANTVVVAFDFRRYQLSTERFLAEAQRRGARTVLICDEYMSPLTRYADHVLTASVVGAPPFDSAAHALVVAEVIISAVGSMLGESARSRLADFEEHADGIPHARGTDSRG